MKKSGRTYVLAGIVSLVTLAVYLSSLRNAFVLWDDNVYIFGNPHIRRFDWSFLTWAFSTFRAGNWHPLTWISHALDYAVWGLNPTGHHLTNIILHSVNTFLVAVLCSRLLTLYRERTITAGSASFLNEQTTLITAGVAALLFGLHPLHVESVAWVSERKDLLCALFYLLSVMTYLSYGSDKPRNSYTAYFLSLSFFALALLSKPMAVSLPAVLLIIDRIPLKRIRSFETFRTALLEKLPFIALSLISAIVTFLAQKSSGAMDQLRNVPLSARILVASKSLFVYIWKMALPINLSPFYPYPTRQEVAASYPTYYLFVLLFIAVTAVCIAAARKREIWLSIWCFYLATLLPVLGIVQVGGQSMADRYTYLPSIGPFLIVGLAAAWGLNRVSTAAKGGFLTPAVFLVGIGIVTVPLSYLTVKQIDIWRNGLTFWNYVLQREPSHVPFGYNSRGLVYAQMGQYDKAIADYLMAISLDPSDAQPYINIGNVYAQTGRPEAAAGYLEKAIAIVPKNPNIHMSLGAVYDTMGSHEKALEEFETAIAGFRAAIKSNPLDGETHSSLGNALLKKGELDEAIKELGLALSLGANSRETYLDLGAALRRRGRTEEAIPVYQKAIAADPDYAEAHYNLGNAYRDSGQTEKAIEQYETLVRLRPSNAYYHNVLGISYGKQGLYEKAVAEFRAAVRLAPGEPAYRGNLDRALGLQKSAAGK